jgi:hypothetical protein
MKAAGVGVSAVMQRHTAKQLEIMVRRRARDLEDVRARIAAHGALDEAAECAGDALDDLQRVTEKLQAYQVHDRYCKKP